MFDPDRYSQLLDKLYSIMLEEVQEAVTISKFYLCPVKSGALRDSIQIFEADSQMLFIIAGTDVYYAIFVEFGTVKMRARPFWRPPIWEAFYRSRDRWRAAIKEWENLG